MIRFCVSLNVYEARTFVAVSPRGEVRSSSLGYKGVEELAASSVLKRSEAPPEHYAVELVIVGPT